LAELAILFFTQIVLVLIREHDFREIFSDQHTVIKEVCQLFGTFDVDSNLFAALWHFLIQIYDMNPVLLALGRLWGSHIQDRYLAFQVSFFRVNIASSLNLKVQNVPLLCGCRTEHENWL
jgi:hypothetical protein